MNNKEEVVAVVSSVPGSGEQILAEEVSLVKTEAQKISVVTEKDYAEAAEVLKTVKTKAAEVTEFFKPLKDAAHKAHAEICNREKACLAPLKDAEAVIKNAMKDYLMEQDRLRREAEAAARKAAQEEAEKRMNEAIAAEQSGDTAKAEQLFAEASVADTLSGNITVLAEKPIVQGVSATKDWEIVSVDADKVPAYLCGIELRPVDLGAVKRLIKASKGSVQIPGVTYKETLSMSARRN